MSKRRASLHIPKLSNMKYHHVLELTAPPIPHVRIALIGRGRRGMKALDRYLFIAGAEIRLLVDISPEKLNQANAILQGKGIHADCDSEPDGWKRACERKDIDLIYLCTEWSNHASIAIYAMEQGKHVAVEVPAVTTVADAWSLVHTAERTRRHCFMLENCCYDPFSLTTIQLAKEGLLGTITHCEGAYIHDLRKIFEEERVKNHTEEPWMEQNCIRHGGNPYPTHGMGPIGLLLDLHRGDRLDYLVSLSSCIDSINGHLNNTLLHTVKGRSILIQHDVSTPRPYSRLQTVCGTKGFIQKYPLPTIQLDSQEKALTYPDTEVFVQQHEHPVTQYWGHESRRLNMPNEMNYVMDCRLIYCLQNGLPLDIDVYDAAEWSCISELSELSARQGSKPIEIPDFTSGNWQLLKGHRFHFTSGSDRSQP